MSANNKTLTKLDKELTKDDFKNVGFKEFLKDLLSIRFIVGLIFWIGFVYFLISLGDTV